MERISRTNKKHKPTNTMTTTAPTYTTEDIIHSNAAAAADQVGYDWPTAAQSIEAHWINVVDTCAEYRQPLPRGSKTRFMAIYSGTRRRIKAERAAERARAAIGKAERIAERASAERLARIATVPRSLRAYLASPARAAAVATVDAARARYMDALSNKIPTATELSSLRSAYFGAILRADAELAFRTATAGPYNATAYNASLAAYDVAMIHADRVTANLTA